MPHSTELPPGVIEATVNYYLEPPPGEEYPTVNINTVGARRLKHNGQTQQITELRGQHENFNLDKNGFQFVPQSNVPVELFKDDETIKAQAYERVVEMMKNITGATHAHIFSHIARNQPHQAQLDIPKDLPDSTESKLQAPAMFAHVDQSYQGARHLLENKFFGEGDLAPRTKGRWGIINAWFPTAPVTREPLAVCDANSLPETDLREVKYTFRREFEGRGVRRGNTYLWYAKHSPDHKWYYPSQMQPGEVLLIKCFDTKLDGRARRSLHSAIRTPTDDGPPRQSVEVRVVVFWEDQPHEGEEEQYHVKETYDTTFADEEVSTQA